MRLALAVIAAAVATSLGAVILGEYELVGLMPYLAALLFGLALAELTASVSQQRSLLVALVAAALTAVGLAWAAWIQAARDWAYVPDASWVALVVGALASALWVRSFGRRGSSTPTDPSPPPAG